MEPSRSFLLATLAFQISSFMALEVASSANSTAISSHLQLVMVLLLQNLLLQDGRSGSKPGRVRSFDRPQDFVDRYLLGSYSRSMFKKRMRMNKETFMYVCQQVAPLVAKQNTSGRLAIPVETRVAIAISRLASGTCLGVLEDQYGIAKSTSHGIVLDFCNALKKKCRNLYIRWPSLARLREISQKFQSLHGIPWIAGAIDGSHIPIISPSEHAADYYNRKGFHSVLLQGVVDHSCCFWDYDIGWCGSIHDSKMFSKSQLGKFCLSGKLNPYALLGDAAYSCRPWMFTPYIGSKDEFTRTQENWNYIQSSSRMCIERAFGILKLRWRILLKRLDVNLKYVPAHVTACLILHNLTIIHNDMFNREWIKEAEGDLHQSLREMSQSSLRLRNQAIAAANCTLYETCGVNLSSLDFYNRLRDDELPGWCAGDDATSDEMCMRRDAIASSLFSRKRLRDLQEGSVGYHVGLSTDSECD